ncbi:MAG: 50S ribosomal protein L4 [Candidatus Micrarchaeota archaeon]
MKAIVFNLSGQKAREIELPSVFNTPIDTGLIKRAVLAIQSSRLQPKGIFPGAGRQNTGVMVGVRWLPTSERSINVGHARLPRMKNRRNLLAGRVVKIPRAVGGPKAHPPKVQKNIVENINKKEKQKALMCAIAATASQKMVNQRSDSTGQMVVPLIVENAFEGLAKTSEVIKVLEAIKVFSEIENAKKKKKIRAGKGKRRGRKYKRKKSILIVTAKSAKVYKGARNLEGVDIVEARNLNAELLAPGTKAGRLTVWTEGAVAEVQKLWGK